MNHEKFSMASAQCLRRLVELRRTVGVSKSYLFYAALELRFTIERTLFEYLELIHNLELSKNLEKLYSAEDLKKAILREEPKFYEKIEFMALLAPHMGIDRDVRTPDLDLLADCYGLLGVYLHAPKRPEKTWLNPEWWERLEGTLEKGVQHLVWLHDGSIAFIRLNIKGQELFDRYTSGEMPLVNVRQYLDEYYRQ